MWEVEMGESEVRYGSEGHNYKIVMKGEEIKGWSTGSRQDAEANAIKTANRLNESKYGFMECSNRRTIVNHDTLSSFSS